MVYSDRDLIESKNLRSWSRIYVGNIPCPYGDGDLYNAVYYANFRAQLKGKIGPIVIGFDVFQHPCKSQIICTLDNVGFNQIHRFYVVTKALDPNRPTDSTSPRMSTKTFRAEDVLKDPNFGTIEGPWPPIESSSYGDGYAIGAFESTQTPPPRAVTPTVLPHLPHLPRAQTLAQLAQAGEQSVIVRKEPEERVSTTIRISEEQLTAYPSVPESKILSDLYEIGDILGRRKRILAEVSPLMITTGEDARLKGNPRGYGSGLEAVGKKIDSDSKLKIMNLEEFRKFHSELAIEMEGLLNSMIAYYESRLKELKQSLSED